ncbi:MAG: WecB/TagA/CpsF family glycosyltransferase [Heliobacteriaceae bacterium]|jgi:exopolysaccharide biosynthesis WecB/TagA/CpsF family protein|nr:WecB/TagA/CpsF family glycosyltransferase [Heliobacteriaceae bacterium]
MDRRTVKLQGFCIDTFSQEEALEFAQSGQVITINPEMVVNAKKNPEFAKIIREAQLVIPDGIGVETGLRILGAKVKRIPGIEFAAKLLERSAGKPVALIGASHSVIEKTVKNLHNVNIVYYHDGFFDDPAGIIERLKEKQPAILLAAMGSPKQEEFIYNLKEILPNTLMAGVGGSFDVWAGEAERAPLILRKLGLEWLYRTVKEPKRFKRIFPALPLFILEVIIEKVTGYVYVKQR